MYQLFEKKFLNLWNTEENNKGEAFREGPFPKACEDLKEAQKLYMQRIFADSIGFAGAKMIRRIVGIAHVADLDEIKDADLRSACEKRCLTLARSLIVDKYSSIADVAARAKSVFNDPVPEKFA